MLVQVICVPVDREFLTLVWEGEKGTPPPPGEVGIFHDNVMDMLGDGTLAEIECLKIGSGVTYWQAQWRGPSQPGPAFGPGA